MVDGVVYERGFMVYIDTLPSCNVDFGVLNSTLEMTTYLLLQLEVSVLILVIVLFLEVTDPLLLRLSLFVVGCFFLE